MLSAIAFQEFEFCAPSKNIRSVYCYCVRRNYRMLPSVPGTAGIQTRLVALPRSCLPISICMASFTASGGSRSGVRSVRCRVYCHVNCMAMVGAGHSSIDLRHCGYHRCFNRLCTDCAATPAELNSHLLRSYPSIVMRRKINHSSLNSEAC